MSKNYAYDETPVKKLNPPRGGDGKPRVFLFAGDSRVAWKGAIRPFFIPFAHLGIIPNKGISGHERITILLEDAKKSVGNLQTRREAGAENHGAEEIAGVFGGVARVFSKHRQQGGMVAEKDSEGRDCLR